MLDFTPVRNKEVTFREFTDDLKYEDLASLTDEMVDKILGLISAATDADVVFEPEDPAAKDSAAATEEEINMPWTLGHVIVHTTSSAEEAAFLAAEMARGVEFHGRSRSEVPWQSVTTIQQCRDRMEESRRMVRASLQMWPADPHLDIEYKPWPKANFEHNAISSFVGGLIHSDSHLGHIEDIMRQAKAARS